MRLSQRLLRVAPVAATITVAWWASTRNNDDYCGTVGECLGHSFDDAITLLVALPLGWLAIRLLRVPRALLTSVTSLGAAVVAWFALGELVVVLDPDRPIEAQLPLVPSLALAGVAALVGVAAVGPPRARHERLARYVAPALLLVLTLLSAAAATHVERADTVADVEATGLTTYEPVLGGTRPSSVSVHDGRVRLGYEDAAPAGTASPDVLLVPTPPGRRLCAELVVPVGDECVDDGTSLRRIADGYADVALVRGDTTLLVQYVDSDLLDPDEVLEALAAARPVPAEDLGG